MLKLLRKAIIVSLSVVLGLVISGYALGYDQVLVKYVSGKYGTKCYTEGQEHGGIKYKMEFNSLEDCLEYIRLN